jgi:hypothetical protein
MHIPSLKKLIFASQKTDRDLNGPDDLKKFARQDLNINQ